MSTPSGEHFLLPVSSASAPDPVTPQTPAAAPDAYSDVSPEGTGPQPAPYDISAPQDIDGITAAVNAAGGLSGAGILYPSGPRQAEALAILQSPAGVGAGEGHQNVLAGFPDYESADVRPSDDAETPIQGHGDYPADVGTSQDGIPVYPGNGDDGGVHGSVGTMSDSTGMDYPGTVQGGLTKYGASG